MTNPRTVPNPLAPAPTGPARPRVLLVLPTTTYRAADFLRAAHRVGAEVVVASDRANPVAALRPDRFLTVDFSDLTGAARRVGQLAAQAPLDAVVGVDDATTVVAAALSVALARPHNSVEAVAAARDKSRMRGLLSREGVPVPAWVLRSLDDDLAIEAQRAAFPCVVKPLALSASRGVIRADDSGEFAHAVRRLERLLQAPEAARGDLDRHFLVERFVPGPEVALEGLLVDGELHVLALFDKPDPLDGPFFEETIYVTPSRLPGPMQAEIVSATAHAARALGLLHGPVHAELRIGPAGPSIIEVAARSIGGLCSRILRFGTGLTLEELILRHALRLPISTLGREGRAAGVMMIPVPGAGVLREVRGIPEAQEVPGVEEVVISLHPGQDVVPLPEGASYLGFIFARAERPGRVEAALREAHRRLQFVLAPPRTPPAVPD